MKDKTAELLQSATDMRAGVILFRAQLPAMVEHYQLVMRVRRAAYDEALAQGFNESQALELAKTVMS